MQGIFRYAHESEKVPKGFRFVKCGAHHGRNGYGMLVKEFDMADNREKDDFYPTPPYATEALMNHCTWLDSGFPHKFDYDYWEPACGDGAISKVLEEAGYRVYSTDLIDRGYGESGVDFLLETKIRAPWIVTNPPYKLANEFVKHAQWLVDSDPDADGHAMLLRLAFLEGQKRYEEIFSKFPPSHVYVFSKRLTMIRGDHDAAWYGSGKMAFAWFVWERTDKWHSSNKTEMHWIND